MSMQLYEICDDVTAGDSSHLAESFAHGRTSAISAWSRGEVLGWNHRGTCGEHKMCNRRDMWQCALLLSYKK